MKYHLIGNKGAGMSALQTILIELGNEVTGSDLENHNKDNIKDGMTIIRSKAVRDDNIEMEEVLKKGLANYTYSEYLGLLTDSYKTIGICGCHGKTTTTAMLSHIFSNTIGSNYLIGDGSGHALKDNEYFIIESCEYKRSFLDYNPTDIIITNIEFDHMDYYKDIDDMISAYQAFVDKTKRYVVAYGEDENIRKLKLHDSYFYGANQTDDFFATNINANEDGTTFDVLFQNKLLGSFHINQVGIHMMLNAVASIAISYLNNIDMNEVKKHLETFKGAHKRFEETFINDIVSVLDYAHHPTEIAVTIDAARQKYPDKKIVAILLPNTYTRTFTLKDEFVNALNKADVSYVMDIYCDREKKEDYPDITSDLIIDNLNNGFKISVDTVDQLLKYNNAVMLFMSCKHIDILKDAYEKLLNK